MNTPAQQLPANAAPVRSDYLGPLIERAAFDPEFKVEKLQALLDMRDYDCAFPHCAPPFASRKAYGTYPAGATFGPSRRTR
jgi:hypothetical protein